MPKERRNRGEVRRQPGSEWKRTSYNLPDRVCELVDPVELDELTCPNPEAYVSPEREQALALLFDALEGLRIRPHTYQAGIDRIWIQSNRRDRFSFIAICEALDLEPEYIRRKVREMERKQRNQHPGQPFYNALTADHKEKHAA